MLIAGGTVTLSRKTPGRYDNTSTPDWVHHAIKVRCIGGLVEGRATASKAPMLSYWLLAAELSTV